MRAWIVAAFNRGRHMPITKENWERATAEQASDDDEQGGP
jgi:hypothetical protein